MTDGAINKKKCLILTHIIGKKNPMLRMFIDALNKENAYKTSVVSSDGLDENLKQNIVVRSLNNRILNFLTWRITLVYAFIASQFTKKTYSKKQNIESCSFLLNHIVNTLQSLIYCIAFRPDIIICIDAGSTNAARIYKNFTSTPYVYSIYEIYPDQQSITANKAKRSCMISVEKYGVAKCSLLISPLSNLLGNFLNRRYKTHIKVCAVSICPDKLERQSSLDIRLPLKFYYHGAYFNGRSLDSLIMAMKNINSGDAHLYLRGYGYYELELREIVMKNGLGDKITFLDPVAPEELSKVAIEYDVGITMGDIKILNNRMACGFKTLENLNAGLALMVLNGYVLNPFVTKNKIGKYYLTSEEINIHNCIKEFVENLDDLKLYKLNSRKLAQQHYNKEAQNEIFLNAIEKIIKRN